MTRCLASDYQYPQETYTNMLSPHKYTCTHTSKYKYTDTWKHTVIHKSANMHIQTQRQQILVNA